MGPMSGPIMVFLTAMVIATWSRFVPLVAEASLSSIGGTVASVAATMLGFLLAILAVLISVSDKPLLKEMDERGYYRDLLKTIMVGCALFAVSIIVGFIFLFSTETPPSKFVNGTIALQIACAWSLFDVGRKLWLVFSNLRPSEH